MHQRDKQGYLVPWKIKRTDPPFDRNCKVMAAKATAAVGVAISRINRSTFLTVF